MNIFFSVALISDSCCPKCLGEIDDYLLCIICKFDVSAYLEEVYPAIEKAWSL